MSDSGRSDEDNSEDEDRYKEDDFVVADNAEEEEVPEAAPDPNAPASTEKKKKKKKKWREPRELDEDDLDLLIDNGVKVKRPAAGNSRLKRLKKNVVEDDPFDIAPENFSKNLKEKLFSSVEGDEDNILEEEPAPLEDEDNLSEEENSEDDMAEFIEDTDAQGNVIEKKRKKKTSRKSNVTSHQMREAAALFGGYDDFMNGDEYEEGPKVEKPTSLIDQFEPAVLAERYITPSDDQIRAIDIPERMQARKEQRGEPKTGAALEAELREESHWIFDRVFASDPEHKLHSAEIVPKITNILDYIRKDNFEIPYIWQYKKDYFFSTEVSLRNEHLWDIYDNDGKWFHLQRAKERCAANYSDEVRYEGDREKYLQMLEYTQTEADVQDLMDHWYLHSEDDPSSGHRRAVKRDMFRICKRNGVTGFLKYFGMTAAQFGQNMNSNTLIHVPVDEESGPEEYAFRYSTRELDNIEKILGAARSAAAQEIAYDPLVRQGVRTYYFSRAEISTLPTDKGKTIDAFHPYRRFIRIKSRPAVDFKDMNGEDTMDWLHLIKAEQEGFLTITLGLPVDPITNDTEVAVDMEKLYLSEGMSDVSQSWNEERKKIIREALNKHILPLFEKDLKMKMFDEAQQKVVKLCAENLTHRLLAGPYLPPSYNHEDEYKEISVMACAVGSSPIEPTFCVLLDGHGAVVTSLKLGYIGMKNDTRRDKDLADIRAFILQHEPTVIAVGAELGARALKDSLYEIAEQLERDREVVELIHVAYVDMEVPKIFQNSARAQVEFPDYPTVLRRAVSIGRYLQDPLTEMCALMANESEEVLYLQLHPLQGVVQKEKMLETLRRCFINIVNDVGVDINRCAAYKFASVNLQFVSGLGPRKSVGILNAISRRGGRITQRGDLDTIVGPCIYTNMAGFIRITERYVGRNEDINSLDNTRIHPHDYNLVGKIAKDALDGDEICDELTEKLMKRPQQMAAIELDHFGDELERTSKIKKRMILYSIKDEIFHRFKDTRFDYKGPDASELYRMFNVEDTSLEIGMLVNATIADIKDRFVRCRLENNITGFIHENDITDSGMRLMDLNLNIGDTIQARIKEIKPPRDNQSGSTVSLVSRSSELNHPHWENAKLDSLKYINPFFVPQDESMDIDDRKKKKRNKAVLKRHIEHPLFQNINSVDSEKILQDKDIGELVIRPSSKGYNYLTITLKFHADIYWHVSVREDRKNDDKTVGKVLWVDGQKYEELDEIITMYIEPMMANAKDMFNFRLFRKGEKEDVEQMLRQERKKNPGRIPYFISLSTMRRGKFVLSFLASRNTCIHEWVSVNADGFKFRDQIFKTPEKLVTWFKAHFRDAIPQKAKEQVPEPLPKGPSAYGNYNFAPDQYNGPPQHYSAPPPQASYGYPPEQHVVYPPPQQSWNYNRPPEPIYNAPGNFGSNSFDQGPPGGGYDYNRGGGGGGGNFRENFQAEDRRYGQYNEPPRQDNFRDNNRGNYRNDDGGYRNDRPPPRRGGYGGNRGGHDNNRGNFGGNRNGHDSNRGGHDNNRGGGKETQQQHSEQDGSWTSGW